MCINRVCMTFFRDHRSLGKQIACHSFAKLNRIIDDRRDRRNLYNVIDGKIYDMQLSVRPWL